MALLTFSVRTFGIQAFPADEMLRVAFVPSGPAFTTFSAFPERIEYAEPDPSGFVSVDLAPTLDLRPEAWFTVRFEWFSRDPLTGGWVAAGWSEVPGGLRVPAEGGTLGDLLEAAAPPGAVMWGYGPPPSFLSGVIYVDISGIKPGLYLPEGTVGIS